MKLAMLLGTKNKLRSVVIMSNTNVSERRPDASAVQPVTIHRLYTEKSMIHVNITWYKDSVFKLSNNGANDVFQVPFSDLLKVDWEVFKNGVNTNIPNLNRTEEILENAKSIVLCVSPKNDQLTTIIVNT